MQPSMENEVQARDRLLRNAVLITAEALFCLGLASLVAAFLIDTNAPHVGLLIGGFVVILFSIVTVAVIMCMKCANNYQSKVQVHVPSATEIAKAYEEYYQSQAEAHAKVAGHLVVQPRSTIIHGSSMKTSIKSTFSSSDENVSKEVALSSYHRHSVVNAGEASNCGTLPRDLSHRRSSANTSTVHRSSGKSTVASHFY